MTGQEVDEVVQVAELVVREVEVGDVVGGVRGEVRATGEACGEKSK